MPETTEKPSRRRRIVLISGAALILIAGLAFGWRLWSTRGYRQAEGIYLADGGQSFIEIRAGFLGRLRVVDGYMPVTRAPIEAVPEVTHEVRFARGRLFLRQYETYSHHEGDFVGTFDLTLRPQGQGDWELVHCLNSLTIHPSLSALIQDSFKALCVGDFERILEGMKTYEEFRTTRKTAFLFSMPRNAPPVRAFLHRVDDTRISPYFALRREGDKGKASLEAIRALRADRPEDRFLMVHLAELEAGNGDLETARETYGRWKRLYGDTANRLLAISADRAWRAIQRKTWEIEYGLPGQDAVFFNTVYGTAPPPLDAPYGRDFNGLLWFLEDRSLIDMIHFRDDPIVMTSERMAEGINPPVPNFLAVQVTVKTAIAWSSLALIDGNRDEARELLVGCYRLGQDLGDSRQCLITGIMGWAVRGLALKGLSLYALNACETEEEMARFAATIEEIARTPGQTPPEEMLIGEYLPIHTILTERSGWSMPNLPEMETRHRFTNARMANLRAAAQARLLFLKTGEFPESTEQLATLFPDDPPRDPFTSNTLTITCIPTTRGCAVYSIGPDRTDQRATIAYDPTNGVTSEGDIVLAVPREREYPFPRDGLRAASARDVIDVFPNGLPPDCFSPYGPSYGDKHPRDPHCGDRLAIIDATTCTPVVIFSVGPDLGELGPTDPSQWGFPIPSRQPVLRLPLGTPAPTGIYVPQWFYDPTNGTTSEGDLFVAIPRP